MATSIYFYGDSAKQLGAAFWAANYAGIAVENITGDVTQAAGWITTSQLVIVVGGSAMTNVLNELCAQGYTIGTASGEFTMFADPYSWSNTEAYGPVNADGSTDVESLTLAYTEALSAYDFLNAGGSGQLTSDQRTGQAASKSVNCGTVSNTLKS